MFWALFLSLLVVWCEGATSPSVVSQPLSAAVSPGNTVKLACTLNNGVNIGSHRIYWFQQKPPTSPRFLLQFHTDSDKGQGSGVPSRFSGSKEASTNAGYLTISGVMDEDEADYYCATWYSNEFHSGTF
uniref:Ig-like domain-containing protein n=1 Tax=Naja naja TaxID=35670 RepID=A0A8C6VNS4_NAJNA